MHPHSVQKNACSKKGVLCKLVGLELLEDVLGVVGP
jgi:hypothetical protein